MSLSKQSLQARAPRWRGALAIALVGLVGGAGCGGDDGGADPKVAAEKKAKADADKAAKKKKKDDAAKKGGKGKKAEAISFIPTLEKVVPEEDRKRIRRKLKERDFEVDFSGTENRDPFRSYLLPQVAPDGAGAATSNLPTSEPTDLCTKSQLVASDYALQDLMVIGIILRGGARSAMFQDSKGVGHIVDRGKCLGREKAKITNVGEKAVCYEITPEMPADSTVVPSTIKDCFDLHPEEIVVDKDEDDDEMPSAPQLAPAAPPTPPATIAPPPPPGSPSTDGTGN